MARSKRPANGRFGRRLGVERLEERLALSANITTADVTGLLNRAAASANTNQAIIAVVDRSGDILGVRVEAGVPIANQTTMVFAIDGAVSLARTAAFFASGSGTVPSAGPLTSRTVQFISQSTITQREVQSSPDINNPASPTDGPGYVAPIGLGDHFPPGVVNAPQVDLFGIEQTNRTASLDPQIQTGSYGVVSGLLATGQSRGIATLPGGIPLYKNGALVGGIGVFFPGPNGFAAWEQGFTPVTNPNNPNAEFAAENARVNAPAVLEAEWMAFAAAGGTTFGDARFASMRLPVGTLNGVAPVAGYGLPLGQISLVGVTLDLYGEGGPYLGRQQLLATEHRVGVGNPFESRSADILNPADPNALDAPGKYAAGHAEPASGWIIAPHTLPGDTLTAANVIQIVDQGIAQANQTRAAIRLGLPSLQTSASADFVFAVSDKSGNILGLYRMPDATIFSIDVAVAKARNTAYYANPAELQPEDQLAGIPAGTAFTNRTFRALAEPRFPGGIDGTAPGPWSSLNNPGIDPRTGEDLGPALPASVYMTTTTSVFMYNSFNVGTNFRDPFNKANQNGVIFFPGSAPLYISGQLVGGFGVSGDGVDQDDVGTVAGSVGFAAPTAIRADQFIYRGVRLPYQQYDRNPTGGIN